MANSNYGISGYFPLESKALLVVAVKLGAVASVETHYGLSAFGSAVLLTMAHRTCYLPVRYNRAGLKVRINKVSRS